MHLTHLGRIEWTGAQSACFNMPLSALNGPNSHIPDQTSCLRFSEKGSQSATMKLEAVEEQTYVYIHGSDLGSLVEIAKPQDRQYHLAPQAFSLTLRTEGFPTVSKQDRAAQLTEKIRLVVQEEQKHLVSHRVFYPALAVVVITVIAGVWGLAAWMLPKTIQSEDKQIYETLSELKVLMRLYMRDKINERNLPILLREATAGDEKQLRQALPAVRELLAVAKENGIVAEPEQISKVSTDLLKQLNNHPALMRDEGWQTLLRLAEYRSFMNYKRDPSHYPVHPSTNETFQLKPNNYVIWEGITFQNLFMILDHGHFKDLSIQNSVVKYNGGPLTLENVSFEGCRFDFPVSEPGKRLLEALVSSNKVTFKN